MNVVHVIPSLARRFGGPGLSVSELCTALVDAGVGVSLAALDLDGNGLQGSFLPSGRVRVSLARGWRIPASGAVISPGFRAALTALVEETGATVIHDHGLWLQTHHDAAVVSARARRARIVAPRGTLAPWSRSQKRAKKAVAWRLLQRRDLRSADLLHATSASEAEDLLSLNLGLPVVVLPNGIRVPPSPAPSSGARPTALFLSRFHPKKGLHNLVEAWATVRPTGWRLRLVGPDQDGHRAEIESLVSRRRLADVEILGPAFGERKAKLWRDASLFVLPTLGENFGMAIGEALAHGVPVITTTAAPWGEIRDRRCGWWIETGVEPLVEAVRKATESTAEDLQEMGARWRALIEERYSWQSAARRCKAVYDWLAGTAPRPPSVVLP